MNAHLQKLLAVVFCSLSLLHSAPLWSATYKAGGFVGPYIPSNISGVDPVMKVLGLRGGFYDNGFAFELSGFRSAEDGVVVNYLVGDLTAEFKVQGIDDLMVLVSAGLQTTYFKPAAPDGGSSEYARSSGVHVSGGVSMKLSSQTNLRTQFSILNGPGRAVLVEVGLEFPLGGATSPEGRTE